MSKDIKLKNSSGVEQTYNSVSNIVVPLASGSGTASYVDPTGNINITSTASTDVSNYATAQVVDANLTAANIAKDVTILGVTGAHSGADTFDVEVGYGSAIIGSSASGTYYKINSDTCTASDYTGVITSSSSLTSLTDITKVTFYNPGLSNQIIFTLYNSSNNQIGTIIGGGGDTLYTIYPKTPVKILANVSVVCFIAGTKVLLDANGTEKNIEDFKIGDNLASYDYENNIMRYDAEVTYVKVTDGVTNLVKLITEDGIEITHTPNHPFLTADGFKAVEHNSYPVLKVGDIIIGSNGNHTIKSITCYKSDPVTTYNLNVKFPEEEPDVDTNDTFIANGLVVHNGY